MRAPEIESLLTELEALSMSDVVSRCEISSNSNLLYIPSECVLYFVRHRRNKLTNDQFERLYKVLMSRLLRQLPKEHSDAESENMFSANVREKAFDQFCEWLTEDLEDYCMRLDYLEVRFAEGVASLRISAYRSVKLDHARHVSIYSDEEEGMEISPEVEEAAGSFDPFNSENDSNINYRDELLAAIEGLPDLQRKILYMEMKGMVIYSENPSVPSIAKALGKADKTIRTHRNKALNTLRRKLGGD